MTKRFFILISIISVVILISSCRKDKCLNVSNPKCENYNPCIDKTAADASFKIYENINGFIVEADTVWCRNSTIFWAKNKVNCSYKWTWRTKGYQNTSTDSLAAIVPNPIYQLIPSGQMYTVTLVVTKNNGNCTSLKSIDSLSKQFFMWTGPLYGTNINDPNKQYLPIFGTYRGYKLSNPNVILNVTVQDTVYTIHAGDCPRVTTDWTSNFTIIRNLAYNNYSTQNNSVYGYAGTMRKGASGFRLESNTLVSYNNPNYVCGGHSLYNVQYQANGWLDAFDQKKIYINYVYWDTITYQPVQDFFTGIRIN
jgi:hypothetical protein